MAEFFLELFCEEMPARMQPRACDDLVRLFGDAAKKAELSFEHSEAFATPRRLALHVHGLPTVQADVSEELKGPRTDAPEAALAGFLKKTGLAKEQLEIRDDGKKGQVYFAIIKREGRATSDVLAAVIPSIITNFPWPKSMRWGAHSVQMDSLRWVRPLQSIVALFQGEIVPVEIGGIKSGNITRGHRFMANSQFTVSDFEDYRGKLKRANVILDAAERMKTIDMQARALADKAGLVLLEDVGLLAENAGLTEWPVVLMGEFDAAFLGVPGEALTATMRANQKYFSLLDSDGKLANKFLCVSNLVAKDKGKNIVLGNQKVLSARLSDAKFFWDQDRKQSLDSFLPKLADIVFHEKLGTMAEKVARVGALAEKIARELFPQLFSMNNIVTPAKAGVQTDDGLDTGLRRHDDVESFVADVKRAAQLCKADLVTGMVGEFPELQGIMGRYYAAVHGDNPQVALAIEEHYKPQGPSDRVPTEPVSVVLALADKLDTLVGFYQADMIPTGSSDPYALRRSALADCDIIIENELALCVSHLLLEALKPYTERIEAEFERELSEKIDSLTIDALKQGATPASADEDVILDRIVDPAKKAAAKELLTRRILQLENIGKINSLITDRLKIRQRAFGTRPDILEAVFSLDFADINRNLRRVKTLQSFLETDDGANLLAGYRRAANILKIEEKKDGVEYKFDPNAERFAYHGDAAKNLEEILLGNATMGVIGQIQNCFASNDFDGAVMLLAKLRVPVDTFFAEVRVNDSDPKIRVLNLKLLAAVRYIMHQFADFSKIEG